MLGTRWSNWLRHCATSWKVAGSIPDGVIGILHWHNPSSCTVAVGLIQPLTEISTMRPVRRPDNLTTFICRLSWDLGTSIPWNPQGLSRPVIGLLLQTFKSTYISKARNIRQQFMTGVYLHVTWQRWFTKLHENIRFHLHEYFMVTYWFLVLPTISHYKIPLKSRNKTVLYRSFQHQTTLQNQIIVTRNSSFRCQNQRYLCALALRGGTSESRRAILLLLTEVLNFRPCFIRPVLFLLMSGI
jgi:hypothetical protein